MTLPQSTSTAVTSRGRDVPSAARYYLGNRWALLGLGSLAVIAGLSFGGWGWLVAAGFAPVILSTLPCLLMCAFGVCMACRSSATKPTASSDSSSPNSGSGQPLLLQVEQVRALDERSDSHA
jgi:hypothetical protein